MGGVLVPQSRRGGSIIFVCVRGSADAPNQTAEKNYQKRNPSGTQPHAYLSWILGGLGAWEVDSNS